MLRKALVLALLVVLPVCARAQSASPDMSDFQSLLDQYIRKIAAKGEPFDTRFDYEQLYVDEKIWTLHRSVRLEVMHGQMLAARPSEMNPDERLAWAINTYNFLVIERATVNLLVPGRKFLRYKGVDQIVSKQGGFFTSPIAEVEGRRYTLDEFQRRFVFGDTGTVLTPRPPLADPRLLFVCCSGRIGGPLLMPAVYRAKTLGHQLDEAMRTTLALPRFVTVKLKPPLLLMSDWLAQNRADLGGTEESVLAFVQKYAPHELRDRMREAKLTKVSRYTMIDTNLNQMDHPRVIMPSTATDTVAP